MARQPFKPTDAEAWAITDAEAWAKLVRSIDDHVSARVGDVSPRLGRAKAGAKALDAALRDLLGEPLNCDRYEGQAEALLAVLQGSSGMPWYLKPKDDVFGQLQRFQVELRGLLWALEGVAPAAGAPQHPAQRLFVMRAADNWLQATGQTPTAAGRFHKCIAVVSAEFGSLTAKRIKPALDDWHEMRGIPTP